MQFLSPLYIKFGMGSISALPEVIKGKVHVITGPNIWKNVESIFPLRNYSVSFVKRSSAAKEPTERDVELIAQEVREEKPESIVAVGGGSVIDTAKIAWVMYEFPDISWEDMYSSALPPLREKCRFYTVETTSGTGSGVSAAAVIEDSAGNKRGVVSPQLIPDMAIYDPQFVMSMPRNIAIYTGMDALTHAIEAYTSNVENIISDTLALKAIEIIIRYLPESIKGQKTAREMVHYGNMLAGMGFTNSRLGLCHAAAHTLGARYGIEHGKINAILLPYVIRANQTCTTRFRDIERVLGVKDLARVVMALNREFGIPERLEIPNEHLDSLAKKIAQDRLMKYNPCKMDEIEVRKWLLKVKEGAIYEV